MWISYKMGKMICPKCHYDWRIKISRCKCGCYLHHSVNEDTWRDGVWHQEHKNFIDSLEYSKHLDWYKNSGSKGEQTKEFEMFKCDTDKYLDSLKNVSNNRLNSFKSDRLLIKKIIESAIPRSKIYSSYKDIICKQGQNCFAILVKNDDDFNEKGEIMEVAESNYELLMKLLANNG